MPSGIYIKSEPEARSSDATTTGVKRKEQISTIIIILSGSNRLFVYLLLPSIVIHLNLYIKNSIEAP